MKLPNRLIIFSGVPHHRQQARIVAHGGFAREIEVWASLLERVLVVCPFLSQPPAADTIPYVSDNIQFFSLGLPFSSDGIYGKTKLTLSYVKWIFAILKEIKPDDIIMARGPDGIGFLGWVVSRVKKNIRIAKYADQWKNYSNEPLGYRIQKHFYRSPAFGGKVMIYGEADKNRPHLIPLYPSGISQKEWESAEEAIAARPIPPPYQLLFVGRFVFDKGADVLLRAYKILKDKQIPVELTIVGDGPDRANINQLTSELGLQGHVRFAGWVGWEELSKLYARSHLYIHSARKEGFGKVLLEAMTYALPIIGTEVGVSKSLIQDTGSGILIPPGDPVKLANIVKTILHKPDELIAMGKNGRMEAQKMLLENLTDRYRDFLNLAMKHD